MSSVSNCQQQAKPTLDQPIRMRLQPGQVSPKAAALELAAAGVPVFPCDNLKHPVVENGFLSASTNSAIVEKMFSSSWAVLIGKPTGPASGIDVLDLDYRHGAGAWEEANAWRLPKTQTNQTLHGGRHLEFKADPRIRNSASRIAPGVDVRATGGYVIIPPSAGYHVVSNAPIVPWPDWLLLPGVALPKARPECSAHASRPYVPTSNNRIEGFRRKLLANVVAALDGEKHNRLRDNAIGLGGIAAEVGFSDDEAVGWLMGTLAGRQINDWRLAENTARWGLMVGRDRPLKLEDRPWQVTHTHKANGAARPPPISQTAADNSAVEPEPLFHKFNEDTVNASDLQPDSDREEILLTEHGVALAFTQRHKSQLRFCHDARHWYLWTGMHWRQNKTQLAFSWARRLIAELNRNSPFKTQAITGKASFAAAVERFSQADEALAVNADIWDQDLFLLGTPGGTIDLRTGAIRPANQADYISKQTAVAPDDKMGCPAWLAFLKQATQNDHEIIDFLQRWFGYCLTGDTREHALLFAYGAGGNGKGVLMNTVFGIMGDYAKNAAMDSFVTTGGDKHTTDMAMLAGARLVMTTEVDEGQAWAEAKIKALTGGDPITARFIRRDNFTFIPQFKLTISGNNKPSLKSVDDSMRRRLNLVPFLNKPILPDKTLPDRLKAEWPAILQWMIEGCIEWQKYGLNPPKAVQDATKDYFDAQDYFGRWLDNCCKLHPTLEVKPSALMHSFQDWCRENGEEITDNRRIRGLIEKQPGLRYVTVRGTQWVRGIGLNPLPTSEHRFGV